MTKILVAVILSVIAITANADPVAIAQINNTKIVLTNDPAPENLQQAVPECRGAFMAASKTLNLPALGACYVENNNTIYLHEEGGAFRVIAAAKFQAYTQ